MANFRAEVRGVRVSDETLVTRGGVVEVSLRFQSRTQPGARAPSVPAAKPKPGAA